MSKLQVETISHTNNTSGLTIDSSGNVTAPVSIGNVGSIVQVCYTTSTANLGTGNTSFTALGLITTITPKFSSSKMVVTLIGGLQTYSSTSGGAPNGTTGLYREIASGGYSAIESTWALMYGIDYNYGTPNACEYVDSPNTLSEVKYQLYHKSTTSNTHWLNYTPCRITLKVMEIKQ